MFRLLLIVGIVHVINMPKILILFIALLFKRVFTPTKIYLTLFVKLLLIKVNAFLDGIILLNVNSVNIPTEVTESSRICLSELMSIIKRKKVNRRPPF